MFSFSLPFLFESLNEMAFVQLRGPLVSGSCLFREEKDCTHVTLDLSSVSPGLHGLHVHEFGDLSHGCESAGSHYNPLSKNHGGREGSNRHWGDLGNVTADDQGKVKMVLRVPCLLLSGPYSILGRSLVLHQDRDDLGQGANLKSKIDGNSGERIACGVILKYTLF